jgi:hypothetical protein
MSAPDRRVAVGSVNEEEIMRQRLLGSFVVVLLVAVTAFGFCSDADAQETSTQGHPLVGTWLADTDLGDPANAQDTFLFTADGGYVQSEAGGTATLGVWQATGGTTATLTLAAAAGDDEGNNFGSIKIRASIEVGADGNSFTAEYTIEFIQPDGTSSGEGGPGHATGVRMTVEAPGTPVMTLDELYSRFAGRPEATPVS